MSKISTIYDAIVTQMDTLYPDHYRLPNPYKPEQNSDRFLVKAWGVVLGPAEHTRREISGCSSQVRRDIIIVLTRQWTALEQDVSTKASVEKTLFEDLFNTINELEKDPTLDAATTSIQYDGDDGLEFVQAEVETHLMVRARLSVEYFEAVT